MTHPTHPTYPTCTHLQEMLYEVKPDLIIETGTNSGGSALYMSHLMEAIRPECRIITVDVEPVEYWVDRFDNGTNGLTDRARSPGDAGGEGSKRATERGAERGDKLHLP